MRAATRSAAAVLIAFLAMDAGAQTDAGAHIERVADGVYAIIHADATEEWPNSNTGVIVGSDGVLVVDATYLPSRARSDIALIRSITDKPVKYVVITHLHRDHTGGTSAYREAFPDVTVISGPDTREFIADNRAATARAGAAPASPLRARLAALKREAASGTDSAGRALSASEKAALSTNIREREIELADLTALEIVVPNETVATELTLYLGEQEIVVENRGRANSPDDMTVFLPRQRVLLAGDIVVQSPLPYTGATWPMEWGRVLRDIEMSAPTAIVPGHGPVMRDLGYVGAMRRLLDAVHRQVADGLKQGMTLEQIQQRVDVSALRASTTAWTGAALDEAWRVTIRALVERTWHELRGLD